MKAVDNFYLCSIIGGGAYGTVYLCKIKKEEMIEPESRARMRPGRRVACKMIKQKKIKEKIKKYLVQEIEIMMSITHKNILRFLEAKKTKNNIYIFVEFCNGGDLRRLLELMGGKLPEGFVKRIVKQIALGLDHLNERGAMHRDLKLDNILINFPEFEEGKVVPDEFIEEFDYETQEIEVIIGDLGFAKSLKDNNDLATSYWGTPLNMAPEIMNGDFYNTKVDIWSLGTMIYELLVGFAPFTGHDPHDLAKRVNRGDYGVPKNVKLSLACVDLLNKCLQHKPSKRITHTEVLAHPFFIEEEASEQIDLAVSRGPGQNSFFDAPSSGFEVSNTNAVMLNVKDSCLFTNHYMKTMEKLRKRQEDGEEVIKEPELPEDISENNLQSAKDVQDEEFVVQDDSDQEEVKIPEEPPIQATNGGPEQPIVEESKHEEVKVEKSIAPTEKETSVVENKPELKEELKEDAMEKSDQEIQSSPKEESLLQQDPSKISDIKKSEAKAEEVKEPEPQNVEPTEEIITEIEANHEIPKEEAPTSKLPSKPEETKETPSKPQTPPTTPSLTPSEQETLKKTQEMLAKLEKIEPIQEVFIPDSPTKTPIPLSAPSSHPDQVDQKEKSDLSDSYQEISNSEGSDSDPEGIDFTMVEKPNELSTIEETEEKFENTFKKAKGGQNGASLKESDLYDELNGSFEIVHSHEILLLPDDEYYKMNEWSK